MDKERLKGIIATQFRATISGMDQSIAMEETVADIDETNTIDPEDLSHQSESRDIKRRLQEQRGVAESGLFALEQISSDPADTVVAGAIVQTDTHLLYIGVPTRSFSVDGQEFTGVSIESPIYRAMEGKQAGDTYELNGQTHTIKQIW